MNLFFAILGMLVSLVSAVASCVIASHAQANEVDYYFFNVLALLCLAQAAAFLYFALKQK